MRGSWPETTMTLSEHVNSVATAAVLNAKSGNSFERAASERQSFAGSIPLVPTSQTSPAYRESW